MSNWKEEFRERYNTINKDSIIYSKDHSIPLSENGTDQIDAIIETIEYIRNQDRDKLIENISIKVKEVWGMGGGHDVMVSWDDIKQIITKFYE